MSLQECRNLLESSCTRTLIAKDQELNSKLGLPSVYFVIAGVAMKIPAVSQPCELR